MVNINKYIKALLHPTGSHQRSHKAYQAGKYREATPYARLCRWTSMKKYKDNIASQITGISIVLIMC